MQAIRDLVSVATVLVALTLGSPTVDAGSDGQTVNDNCPPGFVWIRMSGTGCVQSEPLPAHGKIAYDGRTRCIEPYVGIYEQRGTIDGEPAPGTPYNSFAFLLRCVTPDEYERAVAELAAESGGTLSVATVAGLSVLGGAVVLGGAAVLLRRRGGAPTESTRARIDARAKEITSRLDAIAKHRAELEAKTRRIRDFLNSDEWSWDDARTVNEITGLVTTLLGAGLSLGEYTKLAKHLKLSDEASKALADWLGLSSTIGTASGLVPGGDVPAGQQHLDEAQIREELWRSLENIGFLEGVLDSEKFHLERELEQLGRTPEPDRLPAESYTDHDVIQGRIDEMNDEILDLTRQRNVQAMKQIELQQDLDGIDRATRQIRDRSIDVEYANDLVAGIGSTGAAVALVAGLAALGPAAGALLTVVGTTGSLASFGAWWSSASAEDRREAFALGLQGCARLRGSALHQIETAAAQEAATAAKLQTAEQYKGRLRAQQAKIASETGRSHLWSDG